MQVADRVKETTTSTGTGTVNLAGASTGYRGFVASLGDKAIVCYCIEGAGEWEVGIGTVTDASPDTLSRDSVIASSNANALVNFSAGTKNVFITAPAERLGPFDYNNRFSNPNGTIDQRNAGAAVTCNAALRFFGVDRWHAVGIASAGAFSIQRETTDGEDCHLLTVTTADASLAAADTYTYRTLIEGYHVADLKLGTSGAQWMCISFEIRSSITGTFPIAVRNGAADRSYVTSITVNAANVWEPKVLVIPGDTSGTWLYTNGIGLRFDIGLGLGSDQDTTANTWVAANKRGLSGMTNWMATNANTMRLRKFRLRPGRVPMPFQSRSFESELCHCQRYFETNVPYGTAPVDAAAVTAIYAGHAYTSSSVQYLLTSVWFVAQKRATPTISVMRDNASGPATANRWAYFEVGIDPANYTSMPNQTVVVNAAGFYTYCTGPSNVADGDAAQLRGLWTAEAEL